MSVKSEKSAALVGWLLLLMVGVCSFTVARIDSGTTIEELAFFQMLAIAILVTLAVLTMIVLAVYLFGR